MIVSDRLILLELQKTGTTHLRYLLSNIPHSNGRTIRKHNALYEVKSGQLGDVSSKKVLATIRNPRDWYVSVWAFGCMKKGRGMGLDYPGIFLDKKILLSFFVQSHR